MGGTTEAFRFFLPEALDGTCVGRSACLTFEQGELCPHSTRHFELDAIEVSELDRATLGRSALDLPQD